MPELAGFMLGLGWGLALKLGLDWWTERKLRKFYQGAAELLGKRELDRSNNIWVSAGIYFNEAQKN